jgi:hypothetical protein
MRRLWLCLPPVAFALIDYVVTMRGQPAHYWTGDYDAAQEENPLVRWCMTTHPSMLHGLTFVWLASFSAVILKTPRAFARFVSLAIAFSHAFCAGTWLYDGVDGFYVALAVCIGCAIIFVIALELSEPSGQK